MAVADQPAVVWDCYEGERNMVPATITNSSVFLGLIARLLHKFFQRVLRVPVCVAEQHMQKRTIRYDFLEALLHDHLGFAWQPAHHPNKGQNAPITLVVLNEFHCLLLRPEELPNNEVAILGELLNEFPHNEVGRFVLASLNHTSMERTNEHVPVRIHSRSASRHCFNENLNISRTMLVLRGTPPNLLWSATRCCRLQCQT
mmetsp:Transcript_31025/g.70972  ORF Transcript_31025/g.70972 Transcript_31025/m.70972 type:complete len:201 (+) Transcript_31025:511-1113(+)